MRADYTAATAGFSDGRITNAIDQLQRGISDVARLAQVPQSDAEAVSDWRNSSADLMAVLEDFVAQYGSAEDQAGIRGAVATTLSDDVVRRIEDARLDCQLIDRKLRAYRVFGAKFALVVG
ncbi:MAG: hypothetical protein ACRDQZ_25100, partial [Mycobacteriales bacterium]